MNHTDMTRLFGINNVKHMCNENKLKTVLPLSAIKFALTSSLKVMYITYDQSVDKFKTEFVSQNNNYDVNCNAHVSHILDNSVYTEHTMNDDTFINFPPHDIVISNHDYESKLCILPCHNKSKLFEMIIRQNNIACCIQNIIRTNPSIISITDDFLQQPYILSALYDTEGLRPLIISNKALIYMCMKSANNTKSKRSNIIINSIHNMLTEYTNTRMIKYKECRTDTVQHQKTTLYPTDYVDGLKEVIANTECIPYHSIISGNVNKTRNVCDFINDYNMNRRLQMLEKENQELKLQLINESKKNDN